MMYFLIIIFILMIIILNNTDKKNKKENIKNKNNYENYYTTKKILTKTELEFYRKLKVITNKNSWSIFPQVDLERIIKVKDNNFRDRNRIKSRSIDFTIVNKNYDIICCIELDDYTHNRQKRIERDIFINELFKNVDIKLLRIKVGNYNFEEIEKNIKGT